MLSLMCVSLASPEHCLTNALLMKLVNDRTFIHPVHLETDLLYHHDYLSLRYLKSHIQDIVCYIQLDECMH